jgi:hypothetical protein
MIEQELKEHWELRHRMYQHPDRTYLNTVDYPYYSKDGADEGVRKFDLVMKSLDIKYLALGGTALGWKRDGSYIKDDNDIDFGVSSKYKDRLGRILISLRKQGFKVVWVYDFPYQRCPKSEYDEIINRDGTSMAQIHFLFKNIIFDLAIYYPLDRGEYLVGRKALSKKEQLDNPDKIIYNGIEFNIPTVEYFKDTYDTWEKRITPYEFRKGRI